MGVQVSHCVHPEVSQKGAVWEVSYIIGFIKGKSAVRIHRELLKERRMTGKHFWAAGYWVSTVGRDETAVRRYIREQEHWDKGQG